MANATEYRRGYCRAYAANAFVIVVNHSDHDTKADIAHAAREANYLAGNWNRSRLVRIGTAPKRPGRSVTLYAVRIV